MPINVPVPQNIDPALYVFLVEVLRRAVDGTVNATVAGDIIIPNRARTKYYRLTVDPDGAFVCEPQ